MSALASSSRATRSGRAPPSPEPLQPRGPTDEEGKDWLACYNCANDGATCEPPPGDGRIDKCKRCASNTDRWTRCNFHGLIPRFKKPDQYEKAVYYIALFNQAVKDALDDVRTFKQPNPNWTTWFNTTEFEWNDKLEYMKLKGNLSSFLPIPKDELKQKDATAALQPPAWAYESDDTEAKYQQFFLSVPRLKPCNNWFPQYVDSDEEGEAASTGEVDDDGGEPSSSTSARRRGKARDLDRRQGKAKTKRANVIGPIDCTRWPATLQLKDRLLRGVGKELVGILEMAHNVAREAKKERKVKVMHQDPYYWQLMRGALDEVEEKWSEHWDAREDSQTGESDDDDEEESHDQLADDEEEDEDGNRRPQKRKRREEDGSDEDGEEDGSDEVGEADGEDDGVGGGGHQSAEDEDDEEEDEED